MTNQLMGYAPTGSSPRSRGPHEHDQLAHLRRRFIPAFAGTTSSSSRCSHEGTVHPRVRGDHAIALLIRALARGSSPRSRGPQLLHQHRRAAGRFIPAFAGTTQLELLFRVQQPVHPRVRGDHCLTDRASASPSGSSPRSRGPHPIDGPVGPAERFIPAFAGTTTSTPRNSVRSAVHPRVRGDHAMTGLPPSLRTLRLATQPPFFPRTAPG